MHARPAIAARAAALAWRRWAGRSSPGPTRRRDFSRWSKTSSLGTC